MDQDEAWRRALDRTSAVTEAEGRALFEAARLAPDGWAVEVGTWHGRTAILIGLAQSDRDPPRVATVDPLVKYDDRGSLTHPPGPDEVRAALHRAGAGFVELIHARSAAAAAAWDRGPVTFLWVDGAHDAASVAEDWAAWRPHLAPGAVVAWHDYDLSGVRDVVDVAVASGDLAWSSLTERCAVLRRTNVA